MIALDAASIDDAEQQCGSAWTCLHTGNDFAACTSGTTSDAWGSYISLDDRVYKSSYPIPLHDGDFKLDARRGFTMAGRFRRPWGMPSSDMPTPMALVAPSQPGHTQYAGWSLSMQVRQGIAMRYRAWLVLNALFPFFLCIASSTVLASVIIGAARSRFTGSDRSTELMMVAQPPAPVLAPSPPLQCVLSLHCKPAGGCAVRDRRHPCV